MTAREEAARAVAVIAATRVRLTVRAQRCPMGQGHDPATSSDLLTGAVTLVCQKCGARWSLEGTPCPA